MNGLKTVTIGSLGNVVTGSTPPKKDKDNYGDYALWIKPTDINENEKYTRSTEEMFSKKSAEQCKSRIVPKDSICVPCIGTIGTKLTMTPCDCFVNQSINAIVPNEDYDNNYVYYLLRNFLPSLKSHNKGTASGRESIAKTAFEEIEIKVFEDKQIQQKIGFILSGYDNLIDSYRRQIKLLEEAAQRLYKEWLVDLRFPGYEHTNIVDGVPEGWEKKRLRNVANVNQENIAADYPYSYVHYVDLGSVNAGRISAKVTYNKGEEPGRAKRRAKDGDTIWGMVRPNLKSYALVQHPDDTDVFSTGFAIISPVDIGFAFLHCHLTTDSYVGYLVNCTNGAAYPAVKPCHFEDSEIIVPTDEILKTFESMAQPYFRNVYHLERQITLLTEARDRLLPKLMSGEIKV